MTAKSDSEWIDDVSVSTIYRELSRIPSFTHAQFQASNVFRVGSTTDDHARNTRRKNTQTCVINGDDIIASLPIDSGDVVKSTISPSRKHVATLREIQDSSIGSGKKQIVEVWERDKLVTSFDASKFHGTFYGDDVFLALSFSPSEDALIYIAEINPGARDRKEGSPLAKYQFTPSLGEGYAGKKQPGIFLFTWNPTDTTAKPTVKLLQPIDPPSQPTLFTQAVFVTDRRIFAIGYEYTPDHRLLGIKFCTNRLAGLWEFIIPEVSAEEEILRCRAVKRTQASLSVRCPRVHFVDGNPSSLVWISNPVGGPHASCSTVHVCDLKTDLWAEKVLVESVSNPQSDTFPGIFTTTLPTEPFIVYNNETFLVTGSAWRSRTTILLISLDTGKVNNLTPFEDVYCCSWNVLGTDGHNQLIAVRSSPTSPPELVVGQVLNISDVQWKQIVQPQLTDSLRSRLDSLKTTVIPIPDRQPIETIVLGPKDASLQPCITIPHGGPHSAMSTTFSAIYATLALEGYTISMPLYTGSIGFGDTAVRKLLGKIGGLDVEDCIETVKYLAKLGLTELGPGKQFISGGSHGGFLTAHLIGRYPDIFSAGVLRNPVISLGELSISDIPDWYYEESGVEFLSDTLMTPELYTKLYQMSPIAHVDNVRCPVLLCMGEVDLRVAPTQALTYFHALKGRKKDVTMICFKEDAHGLESVEASAVCADAILALFNRYRK
ncbi:hypothetical protein QCA50_012414 [Cerrena zonata]|uniref:acylaminoacyl-peptidase n=1 Tax=Cerrena zonata TaxID=2478898 RepID=A0AAW0FYR6_9APHY